MRRLVVPAVCLFLMVIAVAVPFTRAPSPRHLPAAPTFNKDVLPILQKNCQECHRPARFAPMSFLTFRKRVRTRGPWPSRRGQDDAAMVCGSDGRSLREMRRC
jgi:hypothetical protein